MLMESDNEEEKLEFEDESDDTDDELQVQSDNFDTDQVASSSESDCSKQAVSDENEASSNNGFEESIELEVNTSATPNSTVNNEHKGNNKRLRDNNVDWLLQEASNTISKMSKLATIPKVPQNESDEDIFGKFVSAELKNIRKFSNDSHWTVPVNQEFSMPCTIITNEIDNANASSSSTSNQSSVWISRNNNHDQATFDPITEAMRIANVYEDS
ncbi:hypothetical protein FQR65_LT15987 [Abscondita terminalis]|nr:hypothetical protein FQR65_LT15987 [Abscondita terminalis]